jgi:ABC-type phosphate transport system ATPase subunit
MKDAAKKFTIYLVGFTIRIDTIFSDKTKFFHVAERLIEAGVTENLVDKSFDAQTGRTYINRF